MRTQSADAVSQRISILNVSIMVFLSLSLIAEGKATRSNLTNAHEGN